MGSSSSSVKEGESSWEINVKLSNCISYKIVSSNTALIEKRTGVQGASCCTYTVNPSTGSMEFLKQDGQTTVSIPAGNDGNLGELKDILLSMTSRIDGYTKVSPAEAPGNHCLPLPPSAC